MITGHHFFFIEMAVDDVDAVLQRPVPLRPGRVVEKCSNIAGQSVLKKAFSLYRIYNIEIIIKINKVLCQTGDFMHIVFYHHRIEGRQELLRDIILMTHQMKLRVALVEPLRLLPAGHKVYLTHPGGKLLHTAKPVFQEAVIAETGFGNTVFGVLLTAGVLHEVGLPLRVVHVDPRDYKIYVHNVM